MKTKIIISLLILLVSVMLVSAEQVNLVQKDTNTWEELDGDVVTLTYNPTGATFDYTLIGSVGGSNYHTLIYYKDVEENPTTEPGYAYVIAEVESDSDGVIDTEGSSDIGTIPQDGDANEGAKVWLVPTSDINEDNTLTWAHFGDYLFEENLRDEDGNEIPGTSHLITYTKIVEEVEEPVVSTPSCRSDQVLVDGVCKNKEASGGFFWTFGTNDCQRVKVLDVMVANGEITQQRYDYLMDIIAWGGYKESHDWLVSYCINSGYDMKSPETNVYTWTPN